MTARSVCRCVPAGGRGRHAEQHEPREARVRSRARPVTTASLPDTAIPRLVQSYLFSTRISRSSSGAGSWSTGPPVPQRWTRDVLHGVPGGHPLARAGPGPGRGGGASAAFLDLLPGARRASGVLIATGPRAGRPGLLPLWPSLVDWSAARSAAPGRRRACRSATLRRGWFLRGRRIAVGSGARPAHARFAALPTSALAPSAS